MKTALSLALFLATAGTARAEEGASASGALKGIEQGIVVLDKVVELGDKTLTLFGKHQPKVGVTPGSMGAVPEGVTDWSQLTGWKNPKITEHRFHVMNAYNIWVADVGYKVIQEYGAGYDGKGKFLKVTFVPSDVKVLWGWNLDLTARIDAVSNLGTKDDPIAGMVVTVQGRVYSLGAEFQTAGTYILRGDGTSQVVTRPKNLDANEDAVRNIRKIGKQVTPVVQRAIRDAQRLISGR